MKARALINKYYPVRGISCNSKSVKKDFIFAAIKGNKADGNKFIREAIERGAKVVLSDSVESAKRKTKSAKFIKVKNIRKFLGELAAEFYGNPSDKIKVAGITGTNGKTTITYLLEAVLKRSGKKSAVVGTINYRFNNKVIVSKNTTPGPVDLQQMLSSMLQAKVNYCVMEVSSHALDQERIEGINFHSAIFTNLTQDHLDYHKTIKKYFLAKAKLFKGLSRQAFAVLNNDDRYSARIKKFTRAKVITYGIDQPADVSAKNIRFGTSFTQFNCVYRGKETVFRINLIGKHNVYNALAAIAWSLKAGIGLNKIKEALEEFRVVPGRLERVNTERGFSVFVDYAHTEDALKNIINSLREISANKIIVVFGCGGERDRGKRPKMGRVVTELADFAIVTSDNPRSEDPLSIIRDIKKGIERDNYCVIPERLKAIKQGLAKAGEGDVVLVAGKGHENYQILKDKTIHFDDREAVRLCLR
ncbi:MAG: UDP-N-acetylmuramoyl-L-alanyl-D-glutamate--2,6-diaminopimelate ligase [Candidatus Omnitrophica bacterium]|nr:UDP-N-acetylmuramoyl-L-alanyl-D-glutamate--2,6-diaminopimelate ligase [Candidatus Omnitrophota bacterium]